MMDRRRLMAEALLSPAQSPVARREFAVDPAQRVAPGQASVGNATQHFAPLDTVDPVARLLMRGGQGQTVPETARMYRLATDAATNFGGTTPMRGVQGVRAFHGSPHDFDRFRMDRIGTGEGAQAYGHGLYFAENEGVARSYRDALNPANRATQNVEQFLIQRAGTRITPDEVLRLFNQDDALRPLATPEVAQAFSRAAPGYTSLGELSGETVSALSALDTAIGRAAGKGRMYEVNLNVDPNRLLDWDAPLSAQPQGARDALGQLAPDAAAMTGREGMQSIPLPGGGVMPPPPPMPAPTGGRPLGQIYPAIERAAGGPAQVSAAFRDAGIPGIRYLDGGSRAAGDGTRNYVMFDDSLIEILRKYGLAGLGIGAGATAAEAGQQ